MSRRSSSNRSGFSSDRRTVTFDLAVPARYSKYLPRYVEAPSPKPRQYRTKHLRVPVAAKTSSTRRIRVKVRLPRTRRITKPTYTVLNRKGLVHYSSRRAHALMRDEYNRRRNHERKRRRRLYDTTYQASSVTNDRYGIIAANRHSSASKLDLVFSYVNSLR